MASLKIYDPPLESVYPLETILLGTNVFRIRALWRQGLWFGDKVNAKWIYGRFKSPTRWSNQFNNRGWTEQDVTDTIRFGREFKAPNKVNPTHGATRYQYKDRFVVRDDVSKELIQVSGEKKFIPLEFMD